MADAAGVDMILVGDSLAMVVLGYDDTLQVTVDDMAHHTAAVARAKPRAARRGRPAVDELPRRPGRHGPQRRHARSGPAPSAVKLEGGRKRLPMVEAIVDAEIPVMGHIGLTPQSVHAMGGFKVQGRTSEAAPQLVDDAKALAHAGCFAIVLEGVPDEVGPHGHRRRSTCPPSASAPGPHCDGQVLVFHDVLGIEDRMRAQVRPPLRRRRRRRRRRPPPLRRRRAQPAPSPVRDESYHLSAEVAEALGLYGAAS